MNAREFMQAAQQMAAGGEAFKRSAVSRAYYCVYHVAREFVTSCGIHLPGIASPHETVMRCLENCQDPAASAAGSKLRTLRGERNYADYDLHRRGFEEQVAIDFRLQQAQELLAALDRLPRDQIAPALRIYAQSVLRLTVANP